MTRPQGITHDLESEDLTDGSEIFSDMIAPHLVYKAVSLQLRIPKKAVKGPCITRTEKSLIAFLAKPDFGSLSNNIPTCRESQ